MKEENDIKQQKTLFVLQISFRILEYILLLHLCKESSIQKLSVLRNNQPQIFISV